MHSPNAIVRVLALSFAHSLSLLRTAVAMHAQANQHAYTVIDKASGEIIGSYLLMDLLPEHQGCEIGHIWYVFCRSRLRQSLSRLGPKGRGSGANTSTIFLLLQYAFEQMGCYRVQ